MSGLPVGALGETAAFVEVDLATMSQTLLREKMARYLGYANDGAWAGVHPHCPPLLLLTTTATRAATFARAAAKLVDEQPDDGEATRGHDRVGLYHRSAEGGIRITCVTGDDVQANDGNSP